MSGPAAPAQSTEIRAMDQQGNEHGSAALVLPAVVHGPASPKRRKMVVGKGWKMMKVDKGGVRSSRKTVDPAENIKDAVKALEAKTEALANRLAQVEVHSQIASAAIDLLVGSVDNRFAVLAGELNQYAAQVEQGKAAWRGSTALFSNAMRSLAPCMGW